MEDIPARVHPPRAETTMLGSSSRLLDQVQKRALESTNNRPASDFAGDLLPGLPNLSSGPIFIHLGGRAQRAVADQRLILSRVAGSSPRSTLWVCTRGAMTSGRRQEFSIRDSASAS